jgi:hypothetical protein
MLRLFDGLCSGVNWFRKVGGRLAVVVVVVNCSYLLFCLFSTGYVMAVGNGALEWASEIVRGDRM